MSQGVGHSLVPWVCSWEPLLTGWIYLPGAPMRYCVSGLLQGWLGMLQASGQYAQKLDCPLGPVGVQSTIPLLMGRNVVVDGCSHRVMGVVVGIISETRRLIRTW